MKRCPEYLHLLLYFAKKTISVSEVNFNFAYILVRFHNAEFKMLTSGAQKKGSKLVYWKPFHHGLVDLSIFSPAQEIFR